MFNKSINTRLNSYIEFRTPNYHFYPLTKKSDLTISSLAIHIILKGWDKLMLGFAMIGMLFVTLVDKMGIEHCLEPVYDERRTPLELRQFV